MSATPPAAQLDGIHPAMEYLEGSNRVVAGTLDEPPITAEGKHVIVLGGGDTAADCLGTAHRQGAASVHLIEVMPEPPAARDAAAQPVADLAGDSADRLGARGGRHADLRVGGAGVPRQRRRAAACGRVVDVELGSELHVSPRYRARSGSCRPTWSCSRSASAAPSRHRCSSNWASSATRAAPSPPTRDWQTNVPGVFVAGDMRRGPSLIVWAIAEGRSAAAAVHGYLGGDGSLPAPVTTASAPIGARAR